MVKAFIFLLFATVFGFVSAGPLERRTVTQLKQDLGDVSNSVNTFANQVSLLDILDLPDLLGLNGALGSMSSGFDQCANDLNDVHNLSESDSRDILKRMQSFAPTFSSSMNQMAAKRQSVLTSIVGDLTHAVRDVENGVKKFANGLTSKASSQQKAAFKRVQNEMVDAAENAASSFSDE